jgi:L-malate glycosyltransferase
MIRILFLNYEYPPLGGGAATASSNIMREFSKIPDLEVDLVTSSHDESFHLENLASSIKIHKLPIGKNQKNLHFQSKKDLLVYSWKAYWYSKKLIKKNSYQLTHSFFSVPCGFLSLLFKWQYKIPYIISLRGADVPGYAERFSWLYTFLKPLIKFIWKKADAVVSNSEGLKDLALKSKPDQKIDIIHNGTDIQNFKPDDNIKNKEKFIVTLGGSRVAARKGIRYLIEAVRELSQKYPQIYVTIIGEGSEKESLENLAEKLKIKDKINFLGWVDYKVEYKKIASYYQEASVFVLPSLNEGMSNAMLEALASGLPILATDTGGTRELVQDGENGFIIKMRDSKDIADKIEILIKDENLCRRMGENSRRKAESMSWEKVAGEYNDLYKKVISN